MPDHMCPMWTADVALNVLCNPKMWTADVALDVLRNHCGDHVAENRCPPLRQAVRAAQSDLRSDACYHICHYVHMI